ncbi:MAG TPA: glycoside hydrolase family 15 protein [Ktedonobacterales bacterium]|nr:glycoside hydrolase family 15 protein [Ktedonobacterales bacterium]
MMQPAGLRVEAAQNAARPRYRPIGDYGVIGDCRTAALIGPDGSIDWCCMPHFDSPAIFLRLLDADKGGYFQVAPTAGFASQMAYLPATNMLQTVFETGTGQLRLLDSMPIRSRRPNAANVASQVNARLLHHGMHRLHAGLEREIGNDVAAAHRILRIATCLEGTVDVAVTLKATFDYARLSPQVELLSLTGGMVGAILSANGRYLALIVRPLPPAASDAASPLHSEDDILRSSLTLKAGERVAISLNYARTLGEARALAHRLTTHDVDADVRETMQYWHTWAATTRYDGPYQEQVLRSALALKLCTFEPTGAIVAAPTTSLPEGIGGVRNWDYRYTWLRDSSFTLDALGQLGYYGEARDYFHFLHDLDIKRIDNLRILYSIRGEYGAHLAEEELTHLEGYQGSRPVRIGNGAATQRQMDVYGEVLAAAYSYLRQASNRHGHRIHERVRDLRTMSELIADYVANHWHEMDRGIWEVRGEPRAFVYSRAMCWVALDRACKMAERHGHSQHAPRWGKQGAAIREEIEQNGYNEEIHSYTQSYRDRVLDSANLRLALSGFQAAGEPQMRDTILTTAQRLSGDGGLLYRYRPYDDAEQTQGQKPHDLSSIDGLPGGEGAFLACTWWLVSDLCRMGEIEEAQRRMEHLLSFASPLGLYSEEVDPATGALLGNYPQAFTHIGLINSAVALQRAQEGRSIDDEDVQLAT